MTDLERRVKKHLDAGDLTGAIRVLTAYLSKGNPPVADTNTYPTGAHDKEFNDVSRFNLKFHQLRSSKPTFLTRRKAAERANFMLEELKEYAEAAGLTLRHSIIRDGDIASGLAFVPDETLNVDMEKQADALIDIVYVAKGTAVMMGLPWEYLWRDVQRANMAKELGATPRAKQFPGQYLMDVGKPEGWKPPNTGLILRLAGFDPFMFYTDQTLEDEFVVDDAKCLDDAVYKETVDAK